jgi:hypothetical protein
MDLIIRNARLADQWQEVTDIGIVGGRIVAIQRDLSAEGEAYDAQGCLACAGLIESHIHLDKSRIIDRCAPQERTGLSPVKGVAPLERFPFRLTISRMREISSAFSLRDFVKAIGDRLAERRHRVGSAF